jgi:hypothetical protein
MAEGSKDGISRKLEAWLVKASDHFAGRPANTVFSVHWNPAIFIGGKRHDNIQSGIDIEKIVSRIIV